MAETLAFALLLWAALVASFGAYRFSLVLLVWAVMLVVTAEFMRWCWSGSDDRHLEN